mgnify:FL=1
MSDMFSPKKAFAFFAAFLILGSITLADVHAQVAPAVASAESQAQGKKPKRKLPTGLLELSGYKVPVFLYVPEGLEIDRKYPFLVMVPNETTPAKNQLEYILPVAKSLECFVLAVDAWPKEGEPFVFDRWLLQVKEDMMMRFPIDSSKVYAIGRNGGGHYAAYLISAYPNEFSGAAFLGEAWDGLYVQLFNPRASAGDQMPVVAAFTANQQTTKIKNEKWVLEYQQKGYPVHVMDVTGEEGFDSSEFKVSLLEWLDQKSQAWKLVREEKNKTFKQRFKKGVKEFFEV